MIDPKKFRSSADMTGWLRAPAAESFIKSMEAHASESLSQLIGSCAVSEDPRIQRHYSEWKTLTDLTTFLKNAKKESPGDDD